MTSYDAVMYDIKEILTGLEVNMQFCWPEQ